MARRVSVKRLMLQAMGAGPYRSALAAALDRYDEFMPAVAPESGEAAMGGAEPYAYYGTVTRAAHAAAGFLRRNLALSGQVT
jgi:hypothetical protein